jgi:hypothetical protein
MTSADFMKDDNDPDDIKDYYLSYDIAIQAPVVMFR